MSLSLNNRYRFCTVSVFFLPDDRLWLQYLYSRSAVCFLWRRQHLRDLLPETPNNFRAHAGIQARITYNRKPIIGRDYRMHRSSRYRLRNTKPRRSHKRHILLICINMPLIILSLFHFDDSVSKRNIQNRIRFIINLLFSFKLCGKFVKCIFKIHFKNKCSLWFILNNRPLDLINL